MIDCPEHLGGEALHDLGMLLVEVVLLVGIFAQIVEPKLLGPAFHPFPNSGEWRPGHSEKRHLPNGMTRALKKNSLFRSPQDELVGFTAVRGLENSVAIASACNLRLELGKAYLPEYPVPEDFTTESYFRHVSEQGLEQRLEFLRQQLPGFSQDCIIAAVSQACSIGYFGLKAVIRQFLSGSLRFIVA